MRAKGWWTVAALVACALAASGIADRFAEQYAEGALKRAFATWAVARGLDGAISVAQGTELALEPGGVGVNLSVGEVLDPVNDIVEQFSQVMLIATGSTVLQTFILKYTGSVGVSLFMAATALFALLVLWIPRFAMRPILKAFALKFFAVTFMVRFALPILIVSSNFLFNQFLQPEQQESTDALQVATEEIKVLAEDEQPIPDEDRGFMERFGDMVDQSLANLNIRERLDALKEKTAGATKHVVNLIVIFLLETIILPIGLLWLLLQALKGVTSRVIE